jgi:glycosyltransferase involved in cell wall biosynthesis
MLLSDNLILCSPRLLTKWNLEKDRHEILIVQGHFLDFNTFTVTLPSLITLPTVLNDRAGSSCIHRRGRAVKRGNRRLPAGRGPHARVDLPGWIAHDDLPRHLNQLRLLIILPSYTEGLPNIMLEVMAYGTLGARDPKSRRYRIL